MKLVVTKTIDLHHGAYLVSVSAIKEELDTISNLYLLPVGLQGFARDSFHSARKANKWAAFVVRKAQQKYKKILSRLNSGYIKEEEIKL